MFGDNFFLLLFLKIPIELFGKNSKFFSVDLFFFLQLRKFIWPGEEYNLNLYLFLLLILLVNLILKFVFIL